MMLSLIFHPIWIFLMAIGAAPFAKLSDVARHPIHVSTTNITFNKQDHKLEVICTIFTDDFEAALVKQYGKKTDLTKAELHTAMDILVRNYLAAHLQVKVSPADLPLNYLGFEINKEATDVYLESGEINEVKKIGVEVSLLHNLFDDQINIVHITVNGIRKSEKLDYPDTKVHQDF